MHSITFNLKLSQPPFRHLGQNIDVERDREREREREREMENGEGMNKQRFKGNKSPKIENLNHDEKRQLLSIGHCDPTIFPSF